MNITVAWEDVVSVVQQISGYLAVIVIALAAMIAVAAAVRKLHKAKKRMIRSQAVLAFLLIVAVTVNMILFGPMSNTITAAMSEMGTLRDETVTASREIVEEVTAEGIILAKNDDNALPMEAGNLNVFGWASTNPVYGGTGSGTIDVSTAVSILDGLESAGFTLNTELSDMYTEYRADRPVISINDGQEWTLPEPPADQYSEELMANARAFSDTALIVLGRPGGEGADLPHDMGAVLDGTWSQGTKYTNGSYQNNSDDYVDFTDGQTYLELSQTERNLVDMVCSQFENVVVVYNGANTMEMGWTDEYEQIKGVVLCAGAGAAGFLALGKVLTGEVNPSGKTVDTWVYDLTAVPYYNNVGSFLYDNVEDVTSAAKEAWEAADGVASFVNYTEGIYVGYRFYETAAEEGLIDYDAAVQYPFGYGLSYTTFSQSMGDLHVSDGEISVDVTVTNTGNTAGKEAAELYYTPPYTNGGIEKASVNLIAFDKTDLLEPGESQTLTLSFAEEDMASYDTYGTGAYVLEQGTYGISLRTDSHTVVEERTYEVPEEIVYDESNMRSTDAAAAENRLQFAEGDLTYLSRADGFANFETAAAAPASYSLDGELLANGTYDPEDYNNPDDEMPTTGADNGLTLYDLRGADYEDERWEELLDQMEIDEMTELIGWGGFQTVAVDSIEKLSTLDTDGPAGVNSFMTSSFGTGYCAEVLVAQTWNVDLAYELAQGICQELQDFGFSGWYGPSMNIHRSAFGGRNFEYYSEDGVLSAEMAEAEMMAALASNIYPYLKHFAFNEQETNRNAMCCTWLNEQSARELYLKPFEECVKNSDGRPLAMMSSYVYIGTEWAGGCSALLNEILREEWGFRGMVLTDYFGNYGYMDADRAVRGGSDIMLATIGSEAIMTDTTSATSVNAMRNACKNVLYTVVNSGVYEDYQGSITPDWMKLVYGIDAVLAAVLIALEAVVLIRYKKAKNEEN